MQRNLHCVQLDKTFTTDGDGERLVRLDKVELGVPGRIASLSRNQVPSSWTKCWSANLGLGCR